MRSTRGQTRADIKRASQPKPPVMTDATRVTAPLRSNAPTHDPGNALPAIRNRGYGKLNTNLQLSRGGFSSYYRSREGWGQ
jgi:hypothetical protein